MATHFSILARLSTDAQRIIRDYPFSPTVCSNRVWKSRDWIYLRLEYFSWTQELKMLAGKRLKFIIKGNKILLEINWDRLFCVWCSSPLLKEAIEVYYKCRYSHHCLTWCLEVICNHEIEIIQWKSELLSQMCWLLPFSIKYEQFWSKM